MAHIPGVMPPGIPGIGRHHTPDLGAQTHDQLPVIPQMQQKAVAKRTIDFTSDYLHLFQARLQGYSSSRPELCSSTLPLPIFGESLSMLPPTSYLHTPAANMPLKLAHAQQQRVKSAINTAVWGVEGRRLLLGSNTGEITLMHMPHMQYESHMQLHEAPVRCMIWSHNGEFIISSDDRGQVKMVTGSKDNFLDPLSTFLPHQEPCRSISLAPTDRKLATASDDSSIKILDIAMNGQVEATLLGHGGDVRWVDWHHKQGLIASGSKDALVKLWDPRSGGVNVGTLHGHKNGIMQVRWCPSNDNWLLSCSRDGSLKVHDVRYLRELYTYQPGGRDVTCCCWHPLQEEMFVSGSQEGHIHVWMVSRPEPLVTLHNAHDRDVWALAWNPVGHLLVSGGGDQISKFWCRARPGDVIRNRWDVPEAQELAYLASGVPLPTPQVTAGMGGGASGGMPGAASKAVPGVGAAVVQAPAGGFAKLSVAAKIPGLGAILNTLDAHGAANVTVAATATTTTPPAQAGAGPGALEGGALAAAAPAGPTAAPAAEGGSTGFAQPPVSSSQPPSPSYPSSPAYVTNTSPNYQPLYSQQPPGLGPSSTAQPNHPPGLMSRGAPMITASRPMSSATPPPLVAGMVGTGGSGLPPGLSAAPPGLGPPGLSGLGPPGLGPDRERQKDARHYGAGPGRPPMGAGVGAGAGPGGHMPMTRTVPRGQFDDEQFGYRDRDRDDVQFQDRGPHHRDRFSRGRRADGPPGDRRGGLGGGGGGGMQRPGRGSHPDRRDDRAPRGHQRGRGR